MTYKISRTDGTLLTEIIDSEIDIDSTDLTLIGKNVTGYGEYLNENFVKLLENFSSTSEPNNPLVGQLWFDLTEIRLKVYDGSRFRVASGPIVSPTAPLTAIQGDFWIDNIENQLYFYDGVDRILAGPVYKDSQGLSGFEVNTITDTLGNKKTVTYLWSAANLIGIFSNHLEFTSSAAIPNFTGNIKPGFNASNITGFKLHATASNAESLIDSVGNLKTTDDLFIKNSLNITNQPITISNPEPLTLGAFSENTITVNQSLAQVRSNWLDQNFSIVVRNSNGFEDAITVKSATSDRYVGIFNDAPVATLHIGTSSSPGSVIIEGNLIVNGSTITINSTNLSVDDKSISLANTTSPSDIIADGGGIILKGTTDHTIIWSNTYNSWDSSENFNLSSGNAYRINNVNLLSESTLSSSVTSALGLTQLGTLVNLQVDNININSNTINAIIGNLVLDTTDISAVIDVRDNRITDLQDPINIKDAVNKRYIDELLENPWIEIATTYNSVSNDRLQVSTISGPVTVGLPANAVIGDTVRFLDFDGSFDINNLIIVRHRNHTINSINGSATVTGLFTNIATTLDIASLGSVGTGMILNVAISATGTYSSGTTTITLVNQGFGYKNGDQIRVSGTLLGAGAGDLLFTLSGMDNVFGTDDDLIANNKDASFALIYSSPAQGWKYREVLELPAIIVSDVTGNLTGNVTGNLTGSVTGNVIGNLTGNVTGNVTGQVLTPSQSNITSLGTLSSLSVAGSITGNLTGNTTGSHFGPVTGASVTSPSSLTLSSTLNSIAVRSGNNGILLSAFENTGAQEQYAIQISPATNSTLPSSTILYGDVIVSNISTSNVNGSSFRIPQYTTVQRDAKSYSAVNYGELIYNTTDNKVQSYTSTGWIDLH